MRIIAGSARGRRLSTLKGDATRPTADRIKEAIFSAISPYIISAKVLDAFAGSGALGLEALSRGADSAWFCEENPAAAQIITKNIAACRFYKAFVYQGDFFSILSKIEAQDPTRRFDLVFLDPPYRKDYIDRAVQMIYEKNLLAEQGLIIAETAADKSPLDLPFCQLTRDKKYGDTAVRFYQFLPND